MGVVDNVFFYALIGLLGLYLASLWYSSKTLGRSSLYGFSAVAIFAIGRLLLPMPFVLQPRLEVADLVANLAGFPILAAGLLLCVPAAFHIRPATAPDKSEPLKTSGVYAILRHPIVVGEVLWPLGLSLVMKSIIGISLTPFWVFCLYMITKVEEEQMEAIFGDEYREYKRRVPGYIPFLKGLRTKGEKETGR